MTNSIHLNKVNQSQQRPLIQSNFTESARKQIKPCTQIRYKTLPLSRPSRMFVTLRIDLQLCNWKTLFHWTPSNSIGYEIKPKNIQTPDRITGVQGGVKGAGGRGRSPSDTPRQAEPDARRVKPLWPNIVMLSLTWGFRPLPTWV